MSRPAGYSRSQIALHWVVAALILFQLVFGEDIGGAFDAMIETGVAYYSTAAVLHIAAGVGVLVLGLWRIGLRLTRGAPDVPATDSRLMRIAAHSTHGLLYLLMIVVPLAGLFAWFAANEDVAELHGLAKPAFIILLVLHIGGALYHQFVLKDGLLLRMKRAAD